MFDNFDSSGCSWMQAKFSTGRKRRIKIGEIQACELLAALSVHSRVGISQSPLSQETLGAAVGIMRVRGRAAEKPYLSTYPPSHSQSFSIPSQYQPQLILQIRVMKVYGITLRRVASKDDDRYPERFHLVPITILAPFEGVWNWFADFFRVLTPRFCACNVRALLFGGRLKLIQLRGSDDYFSRYPLTANGRVQSSNARCQQDFARIPN